MTGVQLALGCDADWHPVDMPRPRRRRTRPRLSVLEPHQLTRKQRRRMTTIQPDPRYL